ncbi:hypothetical protein PPERSA_08920 [Pseudocohnilembus persalinus]|uniref:Uncharacterized protein n=1 Tax=Pseudocohnilembus persalinus TaxID=266149 RepID=A0A0V0R3B4_PSEPJ|nr:hypothetical protein PPERSA_08920 [Pseudocohnilembus persalinus]|eukprot:KRX08816.1 hypothetical protein PPERSA_08920 [Pseudocohnilembus persalinus]
MEVRASIKPLRTTNPETYEDFSQSVINEFFYLKELKKSKLVYMAIHQIKNGKKQFLGDFELDLSPYYKETCFHLIHFDLRNYKELRNSPSYIHKDMRKKGNIDFELQVHSNIKNFNLERQADKEAAKQAQNDLDQIYQQQQQNQQEQQKKQQEQQNEQTQQV